MRACGCSIAPNRFITLGHSILGCSINPCCSGDLRRSLVICINLILIVIVGGTAQAAESAAGPLFPSRAFVCESALNGSEIADTQQKVQRAYGALSTFRAAFVQESSSGALGITEESQGNVSLEKPGKMRWHYTAPDEQVFLVRDKTVWFYQKRERQLVIDEFREMLISELPVAFLMGIGNIARDFEVEKGCVTEKGITLSLREHSQGGGSQGDVKKGKTGDAERVAFTLLVDKKDFIPRGISLIDAGGNNTSIYFPRYEVNPQVGLDGFDPEFPKGVDIIDRRGAGPAR